jgi:hypothetical protein
MKAVKARDFGWREGSSPQERRFTRMTRIERIKDGLIEGKQLNADNPGL